MSGFLCAMVGASFTVAAVAEVLRSKKAITAVGNAQVDTAQSKFGGASALFDGNGDYLQLANSSDYNFTGNYTIEGWWYQASNVAAGIYPTLIATGAVGDNKGWQVSSEPTTNRINYITSPNGSSGMSVLLTSANLSAATWNHWAIVRNNSVLTLYINGTASGSTYTTTGNSIASTYPLYIGGGIGGLSSGTFSSSSATVVNLNGYLDEIRVSNTARYTANFTPSTSPFVNDANTLLLIHADGTDASTFFEDDNGVRAPKGISAVGNAQIDTAQSKFGGASALFDGTGDHLLIPGSSDWRWNTTNYTIEFWTRVTTHKNTGSNNLPAQIGSMNPNSGTAFWNFGTDDVGKITFHYYNGAVTKVAGSTNLSTGVQYHLAMVYTSSDNTIKLYVDGTQAASAVVSGTPQFSDSLALCLGQYNSVGYNGHIDEIRVSNSARYTTTFTPSTTAFVNDSNTLLLIHADGTDGSTVFLDDNSGVPTTAPTTAVAFDGTNDFYSVSGLTTTATDSKYLTIAFTWFHASGANSRNQNFMNVRLGTTNGENGWEVCLQSGRFRYSAPDNSGSDTDMVYGDFQGTTENAWNQMVAYVDHTSFANCKWYVNGVDRTSSLLNGAAIGAVNLANVNLNWGSSNVSIKIGEQDTAFAGTTGFSDFLGRISQIYVHNASGAPDINKFWYFGSNRPRDLGTNGTATGLAQPLIYHYGNTTTFAANNGTGFNAYTLTASGNVATGDGPNYA